MWRSPEPERRLGGLAVVLALAATACAPAPSELATGPESGAPASVAAIVVSCVPDTQAPAYLGDPCPTVIPIVELAVAPVRLPLERVVIQPGPFYCDDVWPGAGSFVPCYGPLVQPGQFMHAWVSFARSTQVAAVMLGRDLPTEIGSSPPTPPPWTATLVKVEIPPAGWTMP